MSQKTRAQLEDEISILQDQVETLRGLVRENRAERDRADAAWQRRYDGVCDELSAVRTAIGRESQRWITQPCEQCSQPAGAKTNLHVLCDSCYRDRYRLPNVCGKTKRAEGFAGAFKCALPVNHEGLCQGITQHGVLMKEIDPKLEAEHQAGIKAEMEANPNAPGHKI